MTVGEDFEEPDLWPSPERIHLGLREYLRAEVHRERRHSFPETNRLSEANAVATLCSKRGTSKVLLTHTVGAVAGGERR
jgi:hypothetical protein